MKKNWRALKTTLPLCSWCVSASCFCSIRSLHHPPPRLPTRCPLMCRPHPCGGTAGSRCPSPRGRRRTFNDPTHTHNDACVAAAAASLVSHFSLTYRLFSVRHTRCLHLFARLLSSFCFLLTHKQLLCFSVFFPLNHSQMFAFSVFLIDFCNCNWKALLFVWLYHRIILPSWLQRPGA